MIPPASINQPELAYENHALAVELIRAKLLEPSFRNYSPQVQNALMEEFRFHSEAQAPIVHPDNFDDKMALEDARRMENDLDFAEQDMFSGEGIMTMDGIPVTMG